MDWIIHEGDCIEQMRQNIEGGSVQTCITSPPYFGLRDYGNEGQIGLEGTPDAYVARLVEVFREVRRVLRDDGTLWLNLGDSYAGGGGGNYSKSAKQTGHGQHATNVRNRDSWLESAGLKAKDLIGIPWRVAFALQADGWYLRQDIIWHKPNPMPESVRDRCTRAHEYIFMLSKSPRYHYDHEAIKEPGTWAGPNGRLKSPHAQGFARRTTGEESERQDKQRGHSRRHAGFNDRWNAMTKEEQSQLARNKRSVWTVATRPFSGAHFAVFPPDLIEPCVLAGCPLGGLVLDPFTGSGTTGALWAAS